MGFQPERHDTPHFGFRPGTTITPRGDTGDVGSGLWAPGFHHPLRLHGRGKRLPARTGCPSHQRVVRPVEVVIRCRDSMTEPAGTPKGPMVGRPRACDPWSPPPCELSQTVEHISRHVMMRAPYGSQRSSTDAQQLATRDETNAEPPAPRRAPPRRECPGFWPFHPRCGCGTAAAAQSPALTGLHPNHLTLRPARIGAGHSSSHIGMTAAALPAPRRAPPLDLLGAFGPSPTSRLRLHDRGTASRANRRPSQPTHDASYSTPWVRPSCIETLVGPRDTPKGTTTSRAGGF